MSQGPSGGGPEPSRLACEPATTAAKVEVGEEEPPILQMQPPHQQKQSRMGSPKRPMLGRMHTSMPLMFEALIALFALSRERMATPLLALAEQVALTPPIEYCRYYLASKTFFRMMSTAYVTHLERCMAVANFPHFFRRSVLVWIQSRAPLSDYLILVQNLERDHQLLTSFLSEPGKCGVLEALEYVSDTLDHMEAHLTRPVVKKNGRNCRRLTFVNPGEIQFAFMIHRDTRMPVSWLGADTATGGLFDVRPSQRSQGNELLRYPLFAELAGAVPLFAGMLSAHKPVGGVRTLATKVREAVSNLRQCVNADSPMAIFTPDVLNKLAGPRSRYAQRRTPGFTGDAEPLAPGDTLHIALHYMTPASDDDADGARKPTDIVVVRALPGRGKNDGEYCVRILGKQYYLKVCMGVTRASVDQSIEVYRRLRSWADVADRATLPMLRDAVQWTAIPGCLSVFYIFDWIEGETLDEAVKLYPPMDATKRTWLFDILRALYVLHMNGVRHNNIAAHSILITGCGSRAVLVDLDQATTDPASRKRPNHPPQGHQAWCLSGAAMDLLGDVEAMMLDGTGSEAPEECAMSRSSASSEDEGGSAPHPPPHAAEGEDVSSCDEGGEEGEPRRPKSKLLQYDEARAAYRAFGMKPPAPSVFVNALPRWTFTLDADSPQPSTARCACYCASDANWSALRSLVIYRSVSTTKIPIGSGAEIHDVIDACAEDDDEDGVSGVHNAPPLDYYRVAQHEEAIKPEPAFGEFLSLSFDSAEMPLFADTLVALEAAVDSAWLL